MPIDQKSVDNLLVKLKTTNIGYCQQKSTSTYCNHLSSKLQMLCGQWIICWLNPTKINQHPILLKK
jgi:hypothetical protein